MQNPALSSRPSSVEQRRKLREAFFRRVPLSSVLRPLDDISGIHYIVKDSESRVIAISPASILRMGYEREDEVIGRTLSEYLPPDLAKKFRADDLWVITNGEPLLKMVEMWFSPAGRRDWAVTSKYPLRDSRGRVVGVIGIIENLEIRQKHFADLGPVGKAVDYIRTRLGDVLMVAEIARYAGLSERQLQRLFHRVLGQTIQQYIIASRIHGAAHELAHSERSIAEIAQQFGFNDQSAFSNALRAATGISPRAYRQRARHSTA